MKAVAIKNKFIKFFTDKGHKHIPSASLIPSNDPTLLFVNAGMVQFKDIFTGLEAVDYTRAVSVQNCVRAGGKHNDLENVGYTARHHTFFEMLGNFSFGDYFKREAIQYAWDFLTVELNIPAEKLWITVYEDDAEAEAIWIKDIGIDPKRLSRCGAKDNFWAMGETGPCGPCSEIFYDHGVDIAGGPPGSADEDGDRYVEIWNLVFMQYNRSANGDLTSLPKPAVDTGMGLERIAAVMQDVHSNYAIDSFQILIKAIAKLTNIKNLTHNSLQVIADHLRSCAYLVVDGVRPSNEGRGYVLRRIMRRAIRHGHKLGVSELFFYKLVPELAELSNQDIIINVFKKEEQQFAKTLEQGLKILDAEITTVTKSLSGKVAFKLYDTYGFPIDLTADILREHNLTVDMQEFDCEMQQQKQRSKQNSSFNIVTADLQVTSCSNFVGYESLAIETKIIEIFDNIIVLENSPFYAESGGQVGDIGIIENVNAKFKVLDTKKINKGIVHIGEYISGIFQVNDLVTAQINQLNRDNTARNHSATHLLHAALRQVCGAHVIQKGSLVNAAKLRFDFTHDAVVTEAELLQIETLVNKKILANSEIVTEIMPIAAAEKMGAMSLFGEKYAATVRVLSMSEGFSIELCGGTHAKRTGDIGCVKILSETGVAAGIRRIEAITGDVALQYLNSNLAIVTEIKHLLKCATDNITSKLTQVLQQQKEQANALQILQAKIALQNIKIEKINAVNVVIQKLVAIDIKTMRDMVDKLKNQHKPAVILFASIVDAKINIIAGISKELCNSNMAHAGKLVQLVASQIGGKGGGRADMAQGGGTDVSALDGALAAVRLEITTATAK
ncbi:MAG: alanine--tRNA ligase [Legionellales bacterium]|nr:MAG: alanine--tRNA ligase [Legionellales bacterium]